MTNAAKKRILIPDELKQSQLGAFFGELGIELCSDFDKNHAAEYLFIVDDYLPDLRFPRIQTASLLSKECMADVRAFIDISQMENHSVRKLLSSYFTETQDFDLVDQFSKDFKNIFSVKIHDYLNVGYFIDTIVVEAYKNKFDFELIRNYLNIALPYTLKKVEMGENHAPIEVSFSYSEDGFAVQIALNARGFDFKKSTEMEELYRKANYFDASYFDRRERLLLSSLWFKDEQLKNFSSYFFTEISGRSNNGSGSSLINVLDEEVNETKYQPQKTTGSAESEFRIKGDVENQLDEIQRVSGGAPEDLDDIQKIAGEKLEEDKTAVKISGTTENRKDEIWELSSSGKQEEKEKDDKFMVKGGVPPVSDEIKLIKEKSELQIGRMKKVMEAMKAEMIKLREEANAHKVISGDGVVEADPNAEVLALKKALSRTLDSVKSMEKVSNKQKADFFAILEAKEDKNKELEERLESMKNEFSRSREFANEEKMESLQAENKVLLARIEMFNNKIGVMSENMERRDIETDLKKDSEIAQLKANMNAAQALIEKFKQERNTLENKLVEERDKVSNMRDVKPGTDHSSEDHAEQEKQYLIVNTEKKILEEKFRTQAIELKKMEQKLKFTTAQLDESQKKKGGGAGNSAKSNDNHLKQLEQTKARLAESAADLTERKKEIMKMKQENTILTAKITELERKMAIMDKKAA
ncbi:MAG: hypothetical protein WC635_05490 [Bacteriovorax sp.]|jgi:hypothetical protein